VCVCVCVCVCESVFWVFWVGGWLKRSSASDDNKTEDELDYG